MLFALSALSANMEEVGWGGTDSRISATPETCTSMSFLGTSPTGYLLSLENLAVLWPLGKCLGKVLLE